MEVKYKKDMGRTANKMASENEKKFFEKIPSNANLSDKEDDYLKYGFFHFTSVENLKTGKDETYKTSIEQQGINADIGENSNGYENIERTYFSIGAAGVCGIINRAIHLSIKKSEEQGLDENIGRIFFEVQQAIK